MKELVGRLEELSRRMMDVAWLMSQEEGEIAEHGIELANAAGAVKSWAEGVSYGHR